MATIQVLCPNGRRQNVKTTPNTKLLQILEDVCQKQGFLPPDDYGFVHGNSKKQLDLSLSMRYANLANNAKLELVKSQTSRAIQDITIALQLESGTRLQGKFPPQTSLWDILVHWEEKTDSTCKGELTKVDVTHNPPIQPVCIYMREEVIGEMALNATSLRKLGLTSGNAVIRLTHRAVDESMMTDIVNQLEKEKAKKAKLEQMTNKQIEPEKETNKMPEPTANIPQPGIQNIHKGNTDIVANKFDSEVKTSKTDSNRSVVNESPEPMEIDQNSSKSSVSTETSAMEIESGATGVARGQSSESGVHMTMSGVQTSTGSSRGGQGASGSKSAIESLREMNIPGVEVFTPQDFLNLSPDEQRIAKRLAAAYAKRNDPKIKQAPFADFKFPEETKGKDIYHNELSSVTKEDFQPCDREMVLFSAEEPISSPVATSSQALSDEFFEVTEKDVRKMMIDLQKQTENDQMLITQSMRELKREEKYSKYQRVVIRVQFPDKLVLQGLFKPKETVFQVHKFVKSLLEDQKTPFYLYTSPPKCVLKDQSKTLILANLVPATLMYFGSEVSKEHYLSAKLMEGMESRKVADDKLNTCLPSSANPQGSEPVSGPSGASAGTSSGASGGAPRDRPRPKQNIQPSSGGKEPGVPKWFKSGKK
ncbi:tether containing UBX domain for GLUT4-like [Pecten maximus]|uniref:tether containing UBX domain for GLUT4-like n=1 Tax=Pecten maximus TaxID=6579 RepID=UPI001458DED1|nr:tether containing UBX domain for GLUT4-like [Pecten maximus]